jgi:hypothetical protein
MPELLRPLTGSRRSRQDIVSAILSDYGEIWYEEDSDGNPSYYYGDDDAAIEVLPPAVPEKQLPLVVGYHVDGMCMPRSLIWFCWMERKEKKMKMMIWRERGYLILFMLFSPVELSRGEEIFM